MISRPPIQGIVFIDSQGNSREFNLGSRCTHILEVEENGEFCLIPWVEVWDGGKLLLRASQHKLERIFY